LQGSIKTNPWKYWLARKISEHRAMNAGKTNENIIGVKTLIDACPNYPKYEEVKHVTRLIIEPFERDLNALTPTISWKYQKGGRPTTYNNFMDESVVIEWEAYPTTLRIESKKEKSDEQQRPNAGNPSQENVFAPNDDSLFFNTKTMGDDDIIKNIMGG